MSGHIEPTAGVMRIGGAYGEPWTWAAAVRYVSPFVVQLMAVERAPTLAERRAIREVAIAHGITEVRFCRKTGGVTIWSVRQVAAEEITP